MAEMIYSLDGQRVENTIHVRDNAGWDATKLGTLAVLLKDWFTTTLDLLVVDDLSLVLIKCTDLSSQTAPSVEYTTGLPVAGTLTSDPMPNNVTCAITFLTAQRGRSYRGRNYIVGINRDQVTLNILEPTPVAAWVAAYTTLNASLVSASQEHVVVSKYSSGWRAAAVVTPVTGYRMNPTLDSQRRRLPERGL